MQDPSNNQEFKYYSWTIVKIFSNIELASTYYQKVCEQLKTEYPNIKLYPISRKEVPFENKINIELTYTVQVSYQRNVEINDQYIKEVNICNKVQKKETTALTNHPLEQPSDIQKSDNWKNNTTTSSIDIKEYAPLAFISVIILVLTIIITSQFLFSRSTQYNNVDNNKPTQTKSN